MTKFIYCFLRKDIEPVQQIIQLGHVTFEAGKSFGGDFDPPHMCLFQVQDQKELLSVAKHLRKLRIKYEMFYEPDNKMGFSAISTEIIEDSVGKEHFQSYSMFRTNNE